MVPKTFLLAILSLTPLLAVSRSEQVARSVTIYRDDFGVPHVYGPTDASCVFGFAYAQAEDNFWQIEDSYLRSLGRAAEVYGEPALSDDLLVRALEIPRLSREEYQRSSPQIKALLDAFADGVNYYLERNPQVKPRLIGHFEGWYGLAFGRYALYDQFIYGRTGLSPKEVNEAAQQGSNMWAVMPSKSANGHSMLFINPHQPFFGVGQWYEGHLHSGEGWDISGASFFGSPSPTIGHNEYLGWSHTVNEPDVVDVWEETFDKPGDPLAYKYDGGYRAATTWTDSIGVKTDHGVVSRKYTLKKTHHGPVVAMKNGKSLTVKFAKFEEGGAFAEWYQMSKATNLAEFKKALSALAIPMFNVVYADRDGNIFYVYNGAVPKRSAKFDWLKPVDGSTSETEWNGYHTLDELPQVTNPKSGFVQNCNSTPFLTTVGGNPDENEFPKYMVGEDDTARARISRRILWNKDKFTFEEWAHAGFDTYVIEAESKIPLIVEKWEALKKTNPARAKKLEEAVTDLREWNHVGTVQSVPMALFTVWYWQQYRNPALAKDPLGLLEGVMAAFEKSFGTWEVKWGDLNRLERRQSGGQEPFSDEVESLPVAGGPGPEGIVFNFYARPENGQKRYYGVAGHSFVSVVEFGPEVKARSILVFGENSDTKSKHYFDQSRLYAKQEFKPAYFSLADIQAHTERKYHPGE
jgi:penicillin amidase